MPLTAAAMRTRLASPARPARGGEASATRARVPLRAARTRPARLARAARRTRLEARRRVVAVARRTRLASVQAARARRLEAARLGHRLRPPRRSWAMPANSHLTVSRRHALTACVVSRRARTAAARATCPIIRVCARRSMPVPSPARGMRRAKHKRKAVVARPERATAPGTARFGTTSSAKPPAARPTT
jgi:hypothetical protein